MKGLKPYELVKLARSIKSSDAAQMLVSLGYLEPHGQNKFKCPYHHEKSGSFHANPAYKRFKCFGCGQSVDGIRLYADLLIEETIGDKIAYLSPNELSFEKNIYKWRAAIDFCSYFNLIDSEEKELQENALYKAKESKSCPKLYYGDENGDESNKIVTTRGESIDSTRYRAVRTEQTFLEIAQNKINEYKGINIASREDLHFVYTLLRNAVEFVRGYRLFPHHLSHLKNERHLTDEEIFINGYFSHPTEKEKSRVMQCLIDLMSKYNKDISILSTVPGFQYNNSKLCYEIGTSYDAIVIPLWDIYGNTHREQLRTKTKVKYLWFTVTELKHCKTPTSTIYPYKRSFPDLANGTMTPSLFAQKLFYDLSKKLNKQININSPKEITIIISEGHFKSYELAKTFNMLTISIQGLNTWRCSIAAVIKTIIALAPYNVTVRRVIIAFDSDTKVKNGLLDNGRHISNVLRNEGIETYYLTWNSKYGKGYDDVLFNGYKEDVFSLVTDIEYEHKHNVITSLISLQCRKPKNKLSSSDVEPYYEQLEELPIEQLEERLKKSELINHIVYKQYGELVFNPTHIQKVNQTVQQLLRYNLEQLTNLYNNCN